MAAPKHVGVPEGVPCGLRIARVEHGSTSTIELEDEWDLGQRDAARDAVAKALRRRPGCLVLDLSGLSFIDSSGIHVVIETHKRCAAQRTCLVITPGPRAVQRVFEICGLIEILPFAPEAIRSPATPPRAPPRNPGGPLCAPDAAAGRSLRRAVAPAPEMIDASPSAAALLGVS